MGIIDRAFWQLFQAVDTAIADEAISDQLPVGPKDVMIELARKAPPHAVNLLRREAERRGIGYAALIVSLSENHEVELPGWWMTIVRNGAVGLSSSRHHPR